MEQAGEAEWKPLEGCLPGWPVASDYSTPLALNRALERAVHAASTELQHPQRKLGQKLDSCWRSRVSAVWRHDQSTWQHGWPWAKPHGEGRAQGHQKKKSSHSRLKLCLVSLPLAYPEHKAAEITY